MSEPPHRPARNSDPILVTRDTYDRSAQEYLRATQDYEMFPGLRDDVATFADITRDDLPLLDLGAGGGRDSRFLAGLGRRVVAVDYSRPMLACMSAQSNHMTDRISYTCGDMLALPFADGRFGGVWASGSVLHLPSPGIPVALREIFRTLAPGGIAELSMRAGETEGWRTSGSLSGRRWFTLIEPGEFAFIMRQVGFGPVESRLSGRQDWYVTRGYK
jgi:SAM-dependent methyltransferase